MDIDRLRQNLEKASYRKAKTMPWMPHEYTTRVSWNDDEEYEWTVSAILRLGEVQFFMKKPRPYVYFGDYRYWAMTDDPKRSKILNRELASIRKPKPFTQELL